MSITEEDKRRAGMALAGLGSNHPVRKAIDVVLADCEEAAAEMVADEMITGERKIQLGGQLAGVRVVRQAMQAFAAEYGQQGGDE